MKVLELVQSAQSEDAKTFEGIPEKRAARVVSATLADVQRKITETDDGKITVAGFGTFVVKTPESGSREKRVIFRPSRPRTKKASAAPRERKKRDRPSRAKRSR